MKFVSHCIIIIISKIPTSTLSMSVIVPQRETTQAGRAKSAWKSKINAGTKNMETFNTLVSEFLTGRSQDG